MGEKERRTRIIQLLGFYAKGFPVNARIEAEGYAIYAEFLSRYTVEQVKAAMDKVIMTMKYFPSIAEIREAIESLQEHVDTQGNGTPSYGEAWTEMIREANRTNDTKSWRFSTPEIDRTVTRFGRQYVFEMLLSDEPTNRAQFRQIYDSELKAARARKQNQAVLGIEAFPGIADTIYKLKQVIT